LSEAIEMAAPPPDVPSRRATLARALKALRRRSGLRAADVAAALGIQLRSYENFEAGRGRLNVDRVHQVARILGADPFAILTAVDIRSPDFAVRCAENKLMAIFLRKLRDFDAATEDQIAQLDPAILMESFTQMFASLTQEASEREAMSKIWPPEDGGSDPEDGAD
jgi:transcriptional regulator with XRE-family HTH domain